ncbi:MAG: thioredoxin family protein [Thiobacillaceae bacterium]
MHPVLYVLIAFLAVIFLVTRAGIIWRARSAVGQSAPDTGAVDDEASKQARRVYYFYGRHCGPCKAMMPVLEAVSRDHPNLVKIDVGKHPDLTRSFGVRATPAFVLVENGLIKRMKLGAMSEARLRDMLNEG